MCTGLGGVSHWEAVGEKVGACWIGGGMCRPLGKGWVWLQPRYASVCTRWRRAHTSNFHRGAKVSLRKKPPTNQPTKQNKTKKENKPKLRRQNPLEMLESCIAEAVNEIRDSVHRAIWELPAGTKFHNFSPVGRNFMLQSLPAKNNN